MKLTQLRVLIALICLGGLTAGCNSIRAYPDRVVSEKTELKLLVQYFTNDVIRAYDSKSTPASKRDYRDTVVNGRLRAIDLQFEIFQKGINIEKNASQMGTDLAVLGLSGAGATTGGAAAKTVLAAISGGLTGAKLSFDKTLYYEKTMPVLLAQMEANRSQQLLNIRRGLQGDTVSYPLTQALADVDRYYTAGTLPGAIIALGEAAGTKATSAHKELDEVIRKGSYSSDEASLILRRFWKPDGSRVDAANQKKLKDWMAKPENDLDPDALTFFLYDKSEKSAEARTRAVLDLQLK